MQQRVDVATAMGANPGADTAATLRALAARAHVGHVSTPGLNALSARNPGGPLADAGAILTPGEIARASTRLAAMSDTDQERFDALLAIAGSPQAAAYLWKALAAGHSVSEVDAFAQAISPHGNDPLWLAEHLTPTLDTPQADNENATTNTNLSYKGQRRAPAHGKYGAEDFYDQGNYNDCVPASTVVAQASVDPVLMLNLTTGGTANGADSPQAFQDRLQHHYQDMYVHGVKEELNAAGIIRQHVSATDPQGITAREWPTLLNPSLGQAVGTTYTFVPLNSTTDRQHAIARIQQAVDSGVPVPLGVVGDAGGHAMVIIGRDRDKFEVYNPWGFTAWVSASQFVNNQLGSLTAPQNLDTAVGVLLPK